MHARMGNPAIIVPGAMQALQALGHVAQQSGVPAKTLELISLRASQINGCGVCAVQHPRIARKLGETDERLFAVAAWREAPYFTDAERAALALTEAVTRLATGRIRCRMTSGTRPPGTTMSKRWRPWSSPSRTSTSGTGSTSPPGRLRARSGKQQRVGRPS